MKQWQELMGRVLTGGVCRPDRTGTGTLALFGEQLVFDNTEDSFPAVTTKRLAIGQVAKELACFVRGYDRLDQFHEVGCTIWDANGNDPRWKAKAYDDQDLGRIYGVNWRDWTSVDSGFNVKSTDQLKKLVEGLRTDPFSRRHMVMAYNPGELDQVCLPACHVLFQCFAYQDAACEMCLDLRVDMRSVDLFLGLPFDVASYAILQRLIANEVGMTTRRLVFQLGDAHVYLNHVEQVKTVLSRAPERPPTLCMPPMGMFDFEPELVTLAGYLHHGAVAAPMNV